MPVRIVVVTGILKSIDTTGIKLIDQTNEAYSDTTFHHSDEPVRGGYVYEKWTFTGLKSGEYILIFYYKRFEREIEGTETIKIIVK